MDMVSVTQHQYFVVSYLPQVSLEEDPTTVQHRSRLQPVESVPCATGSYILQPTCKVHSIAQEEKEERKNMPCGKMYIC
jgi:hypothetical protein